VIKDIFKHVNLDISHEKFKGKSTAIALKDSSKFVDIWYIGPTKYSNLSGLFKEIYGNAIDDLIPSNTTIFKHIK
jgi:hypothetical protein